MLLLTLLTRNGNDHRLPQYVRFIVRRRVLMQRLREAKVCHALGDDSWIIQRLFLTWYLLFLEVDHIPYVYDNVCFGMGYVLHLKVLKSFQATDISANLHNKVTKSGWH